MFEWLIIGGAILLLSGSKGQTVTVPPTVVSSDTSYQPVIEKTYSDREQVVQRARSGIGSPYNDAKWVSKDLSIAKPEVQDYPPFARTEGADCSGFARWAFLPFLTLPHGTVAMKDAGLKQMTVEDAKNIPGLLIFDKNSGLGPYRHVGVTTGQGTIVEALNKSQGIVESSLRSSCDLVYDPWSLV